MKKGFLSILLCAALVSSSFAGCSGSTAPSPQSASQAPSQAAPQASSQAAESKADTAEKKSYKVGFIVGSREHVFYNIIEEAIVNKSKELGIEALVYDGELDANVQSNHIENLVAMKVDAIALATVDAAGVGPAIEAADAAGIPCFTFDSGCDTVSVIKCHVGTDNVEGGRLGAKEVIRLLKPGATAAMIGNPASSSVLDRQKGFEEVMNAQKDIENKFFGNYEGDANKAMGLMQDWLVSDPKLGAVFCAGDPAATGALSAIKSAGASTLVIGFDGNPEAITAIHQKDGDGKWWVSEISQNPKLIGETITEQILKYLTTGSVDAEKIPISPYIITYEYIEKNGLAK
ncbi:substrate-binding domain-containing protein [Oscillospiraceae bacterium PP1C4]